MQKLRFRHRSIAFLFLLLPFAAAAQKPSSLGAWHGYFGNALFKNSPFSLHLEAQYRDHTLAGDVEQLLLRGGFQYNLKDRVATFTVGHAFVQSQREGSENAPISENRLYQEALFRQNIGRFRFTHRFRYEQRFIENQSFRTRFRYAVGLNILLNRKDLAAKTWYLAFSNEVFLNGEHYNGGSIFDRNRLALGFGYAITPRLLLQAGVMDQILDARTKRQLQLSVFHTFAL